MVTKKQLQKQIAKLQSNAARKSNPGRRRERIVRGVVPNGTPVTNNPGRSRGNNNPSSQSIATVRMARAELLYVVKTDSKTTDIKSFGIIPNSFNLLKTIAMSFENIVYNKFRVYWKPAVGTTTNGMVSYGIDFGFIDVTQKDRAWIGSLTPNYSHSLWSDTSSRPLVVNTSMMRTRNKYVLTQTNSDATFGQLVIAWDGPTNSTLGEIWVDYDVTLSGTRAAQQLPSVRYNLDEYRLLHYVYCFTATFPYNKPGSFTEYAGARDSNHIMTECRGPIHVMAKQDRVMPNIAAKSKTYTPTDNGKLNYAMTTVIANSGTSAEYQGKCYNYISVDDPIRELIGQFVTITITISVQILGGSKRSSLPEWEFVSSGMFGYLQYDWRDFPSYSYPDSYFTSVLTIRGILQSLPPSNTNLTWGEIYFDVEANGSTRLATSTFVSMCVVGGNTNTLVFD